MTTSRAHGSRAVETYVFGIFVVPLVIADENRVSFQEVDFVLTREVVVTVRKTPAGGVPFDAGDVLHEGPAGEIAASLADAVAERFLGAADALDSEVDEVDNGVEELDPAEVRQRIRSLRQDLLRVRRVIGPTREAFHKVVDKRIDLEGTEEVFPREVEVLFGDAYDKLLRAVDGVDLARDLLAGARDYLQAKVANDQNEVVKRLTVIGISAGINPLPYAVNMGAMTMDGMTMAAPGAPSISIVPDVGCLEADEESGKRRLAAAALPDDPERPPGLELERDAADRAHRRSRIQPGSSRS